MNKKVASALVLCAAAIVLCVVYVWLARSVPTSSDNAAIVLEVQSLMQGNLLLHGWNMPPDTFLTTDIPFYVVGMSILGFSPVLMHAVPVFIYVIVVFLSIWLAMRGPSSGIRKYKGLAAFVLTGLPSTGLAYYVFQGPIHIGTILFTLLAFVVLDAASAREMAGRPVKGYLTAFGVILAWAVIGDPYALWIAAYPALFVSLVRLIRKPNTGFDLKLVMTIVFSSVFGKAVAFAIPHLGGYEPQHLHNSFVALSALISSILTTLQSILRLFNADFFGRSINSISTFIVCARLIGAAAVCWVLRQFVKRYQSDGTLDRISEVLAASMVINLLSYALSNRAGADDHTARYVVPFVIFGAILVGRWGLRLVQQRRMAFVVGALGLIYTVAFLPSFAAKPAYSPYLTLGNWLQSHGLKYGYGTYWDASIVTVQKREAVVVRPVTMQNHQLVSYHWLADNHWYDQDAKSDSYNFLVFDDSNFQGVNLNSAIQAFGQPDHMYRVGKFTVLTWNYNISEKLLAFPASLRFAGLNGVHWTPGLSNAKASIVSGMPETTWIKHGREGSAYTTYLCFPSLRGPKRCPLDTRPLKR